MLGKNGDLLHRDCLSPRSSGSIRETLTWDQSIRLRRGVRQRSASAAG